VPGAARDLRPYWRGGGGPPTIADFDGDGKPEVGVAGANYYAVYDTDGTVLWQQPNQDYSSQMTGSSVYDFDGDGKAEVVYADEVTLWIFDGATGDILLQETGHASGTLNEYPVIADVDRDGHTDIILASNNYAFSGWTGITVLEDLNNTWVTGRPVWNQHAYHITNVNDDLSIPAHEVPNWIDGNNTFRQGGFSSSGALVAPDLSPVLVSECQDACPDTARILFQVENSGFNVAAAGTPYTLYGEAMDGTRTALITDSIADTIPVGWASDTIELDVDVAGAAGFAQLVLAIDDDGTGAGIQNECTETNNELIVPDLCE
jgi:hypothetical protein